MQLRMAGLELFQEADRQVTTCNACRYCEGLCAVFPAIEARRSFTKGDIRYLANLCHDCRACYQACMYTPPHEFAMNIPQLMSEVRMESYQHWSWPSALARSFTSRSRSALLGCFAAAVVVIAALLLIPSDRLFATQLGPGAFYRIVPYLGMVIPGLTLFFYGIVIWLRGIVRFWNEPDSPLLRRPSGLKPLFRAIQDAATLKYLDGGGRGCFYSEQAPSQLRRIFHTCVVVGFLLDLVSTTLAFIYQDLLHILPPYPYLSAPVVFGTVGGVFLVIGAIGLLAFKLKSDRALGRPIAYSLDYAFLLTLGLTGLTGLLVLLVRTTSALGTILILHLAAVAALFLTAPYGKFVHFVYRSFALLRFEIERGAEQQGGH